MITPLRPIVTVLGTTGVGKSKLAIELALHLNATASPSTWRGAKIINADSMQVYEGLDIITNKVPHSERQGIEHLMMGFKQPGEQYVVGQWVQDTLQLIDELHRNHQIPIVVGGTAYWIQHLMFPNRLVPKRPTERDCEPVWSEDLLRVISTLPPDLSNILENLPEEPPSAKADPDGAFQLHVLLSKIDPLVAQRWHWRDTRKVLRSLQIIKESRRLPSDIIADQSSSNEDSGPRFRSLCFWLYAEPIILGSRLDARVDDMISQGLVDEVRKLRCLATLDQDNPPANFGSDIDYTLGIYQAIGYKEFCAYLDNETDASFQQATERMKISTRQYARRQISWIRNKLIPAVEAANVKQTVAPLYLWDATGLGDEWQKGVETPAIKILDGFLAGETLSNPKSCSGTANRMLCVDSKDINPTVVLQARQKRICPICTAQDDRPVMIEEGSEWEIHQRTRSHQRLAAKVRRSPPPPP